MMLLEGEELFFRQNALQQQSEAELHRDFRQQKKIDQLHMDYKLFFPQVLPAVEADFPLPWKLQQERMPGGIESYNHQ